MEDKAGKADSQMTSASEPLFWSLLPFIVSWATMRQNQHFASSFCVKTFFGFMTQFRTFLEMVSRTRIQLRKVGVLRVGQPIEGTDGRGRRATQSGKINLKMN